MRITLDLMIHVGLMAYNIAVSAKLPTDTINALVKGIREVCGHYSTTNEAVAAWPALEYLLTGYAQQQDLIFNGPPKPLPDGVDAGFLTSIIARAKLGV